MKLNREGVQLNAEERNKRNQNWATLEVELDGIGEKIADSGDAKELAENVQAQVNALVVQGDSSVEARQARVDAKGVEAATLKARLDAEQNAVTAQLADTAITPETYNGNALEKIQSAINDAISQKRSVRFSKMYDITGLGSIVFNKPESDRTVLHLIGAGGGIKKTDVGYIYTSSSPDMGDITENSMKYEGGFVVGGAVWDGNSIIRINSIGCGYDKIDVYEADKRWAQTINFQNFTVTRNPGWAFSWKQSFDVKLDGFIEIGINGIRNSGYTANPDNFNLKIDCMIEGMIGQGIELGSCAGSEISTYMEQNKGGYVDLSKSDNFHVGLQVSRSTFSMTEAQIANHTKAIKWGKIGNDGVFSVGNFSNGDLHEINKDVGSFGKLIHVSDRATGINVSDNSMAIDLMNINKKVVREVNGGTVHETGTLKLQTCKTVQTPTIPVNGISTVSVPVPEPLVGVYAGYPVIFSFSIAGSLSEDYQIVSHTYEESLNVVNVKIKNLHPSDSQHFLIFTTTQELK